VGGGDFQRIKRKRTQKMKRRGVGPQEKRMIKKETFSISPTFRKTSPDWIPSSGPIRKQKSQVLASAKGGGGDQGECAGHQRGFASQRPSSNRRKKNTVATVNCDLRSHYWGGTGVFPSKKAAQRPASSKRGFAGN